MTSLTRLTQNVLMVIVSLTIVLSSCVGEEIEQNIVVENLIGLITIKKIIVGGMALNKGPYKVVFLNKRTVIFGPEYSKYVIDGARVSANVSREIPKGWDKEVVNHYPEAVYVSELLFSKRLVKKPNGERVEISLYP